MKDYNKNVQGYVSDKMPYEKYRDGDMLFEIKKHVVRDYYPHFHYATEICCVQKGEFNYIVNGKLGQAQQGEILFINPSDMHQYFESEECEVIICILSEKYTADYTAEFGSVAYDNLLTDKAVNAEIIRLMEEEYDKQYSNYFMEDKIFANRLYTVLHRAYEIKKHEPADFLLNKTLEYVYNHYNEPLTVELVAKQLSYSPVTISKLFQKKINVDFRVFVNNVRADMVHKMIRDAEYKDWKLIQIVNECGFDSMATFYRSYKRRYNELPSVIIK